MYSKFIAGSIITASFLFAGAAASHEPVMASEKLDSGPRSLPPYGERHKNPELTHMVAPEMGPAVMAVVKKTP